MGHRSRNFVRMHKSIFNLGTCSNFLMQMYGISCSLGDGLQWLPPGGVVLQSRSIPYVLNRSGQGSRQHLTQSKGGNRKIMHAHLSLALNRDSCAPARRLYNIPTAAATGSSRCQGGGVADIHHRVCGGGMNRIGLWGMGPKSKSRAMISPDNYRRKQI
ncbi:hypothetical protein B0H34DRAFT_102159 [Crassisporium funariophilum]|nr:hypothetical protein B0H34DRAFT_102159 [Crassisporium funariophilum]